MEKGFSCGIPDGINLPQSYVFATVFINGDIIGAGICTGKHRAKTRKNQMNSQYYDDNPLHTSYVLSAINLYYQSVIESRC